MSNFPEKRHWPGLVLAINLIGFAAVHAASVTGLRCESLDNPEGIDVLKPRLTWVMESRSRGDQQTAWQVMVATSKKYLNADQPDLWDSGKVVSSQSVDVTYAGKRLDSMTECYWKVRIWDREGKVSGWSLPARWTMGWLSPADWTAKWIGWDETNQVKSDFFKGAKWIWYPEGQPASSAPVATRYFSRTFDLPKDRQLSQAVLYWTADNEGKMTINGKVVGISQSFQVASTADVTSILHSGSNTIFLAGRNSGSQANPAGAIVALHLQFRTGEPMVIPSDAHWTVSKSEQGGESVAALELGNAGMGPWGETKTADNQRQLPARWLRKEFSVDRGLYRATVSYSGLGWSELHVNGRRIGDEVLSPALSDYSKRVFYVTHDITETLKTGSNAIGVVLGNGRFFAPRIGEPAETRTFGYPKLLLQLRLEYKDGHVDRIVSDESWRMTTAGPILANNEYDGEQYDANRELGRWAEAGYREYEFRMGGKLYAPDGVTNVAMIDTVAAGTNKTVSLKESTPGVWVYGSDQMNEWKPVQLVQAPDGVLSVAMMNPIRVTGTIKPVSIKELTPGVWIYDFGQNFAGWCRLSVKGVKGETLTLRHAERLNEDGSLYVDNLRGAKVTDTFVLKGRGLEVYEPHFTLHGFRYVELRGMTRKPELDTLLGIIVNDDLEKTGDFRCSNPMINAIYSNVVWGVRGNYRSIPTDCPQRDERQGWLGDRSAESRGEGYLFQHRALYAKWVQDMADSQRPDGVVSDVCPNYWSFYSDSITWPGSMTIIPNTLFELTGDRAVIERQYPAIALWLKHHIGLIKDGISTADNYGDWCVPPEDPKLIHSNDPARKTAGALIATTYLYHCLKLGAGYATMLGMEEDAKQYEQVAEVLKKGLNDRFFKKDVGYYDNGSATSCILPLAFGMVPPDQAPRVVEHLVNKIEKENKDHACFGLIGGQWIYSVLARYGHSELAYRLASQETYPSLGYMVTQGATTIWELWNGNTADPAMNSGNHVMLVGDFVTWLYESLAGIASDPRDPGFHHILMNPTPVGNLAYVHASHVSAYGKIVSHWSRKDGVFHWDVTVPPNSSATLFIPAGDESRIDESGKPVDRSQGLKRAKDKDKAGRIAFTATSGAYHFNVK